jgi:hypothetical protein
VKGSLLMLALLTLRRGACCGAAGLVEK